MQQPATPTQPPPSNGSYPVDTMAILAGFQEQLDALRETVAAQQRSIDALVAASRTPPRPAPVRRRFGLDGA